MNAAFPNISLPLHSLSGQTSKVLSIAFSSVFQYYDSIQWRSCISRAIVTSRRTSCINAREVIVLKKIFTHVLFLAVLLMGAVPAHAAVQINSTSFPDEAFRTLVQKFDTSKDGALSDSEISAVTEIDCEKNTSIRDVTGIAYFTSLKSLSVWKCPLSKLNVSQNRQLEYLDCCETGISALDVRSNPNIHQLWCYGNHFTELDLTKSYYLVKAYTKGIYKNDTYISYADDQTGSYLALDKTVKLILPSGTAVPDQQTPTGTPGTSTSNPQTSAGTPGTSTSNPQAPAGTPGPFVGIGETMRFDEEVTIPGALLDGAFKVDCTDIVSITQARTGNMIYADGVTYFFTIWVTGKKPGTTTITVYDNSKTKQIWSTTITVYGDDPEAENPKEQQDGTKSSATQTQTADGSKPVSESKKQTVPKVGTKLTHSGSGLIYVVSKKGKEVSLKGVSGKKKTIKVPLTVTLKGIKYKVTAISAGAFKGNKIIQNVTIGSSITKIGDKAFSGCTALKKIVLPASVKSIGKEAFLKCAKLSNITIKTTKLTSKKVGKNAFKGISARAVLKVPARSRKAYTALLKKKGLPAKAKIK